MSTGARPSQMLARKVVGPLFRSFISRSSLSELSVALRMKGLTLHFRPFALGDLFVAAGILWEGMYEPQVLEVFEPRKGEVFVDVGAHIGFYTLRAARLVGPDGMVVAFEPNPENYSLLARNVRSNRLSNVLALNMGVSDFVGEAELVAYKNEALGVDPAFTRLRRMGQHGGGLTVAVSDLDTSLDSVGVSQVDWLKIDAEGHELQILRGAKKTLRSPRIKLIVEIEDERAGEFLTSMGFKRKRLAVSPSGLCSMDYFYRHANL